MLRRTALFTVLALAVAVPALVACEGGGEDGEGEGEEGEGEGNGCTDVDLPTCDEDLTAACRDEAFPLLEMNLTTAAPGAIDSVAIDGGFEVSVDATAGGFGGNGGWVYGRFTDDGLEKVDLTDDASFDSTEWDIAFRRFIVRLNSGYAGPGCVSAANIGKGTPFEDVSCVPDGAIFNIEDAFLSDSDSCTLVPDGSGLGSPGVVLQNWWDYPAGCVATTGNVYVIATGDGRLVKFEMTQYYKDAQPACNDDATIDGESARVKLKYGYLE